MDHSVYDEFFYFEKKFSGRWLENMLIRRLMDLFIIFK